MELGAGSATKTRIILDAMRTAGCAECYVPIDVSKDFLEAPALQLQADYSDVKILPVVSDISESFSLPPVASPTLVGFLGSTIGNFPRESAVKLLSHIARLMAPVDRFLLGADLIKDSAVITRAYNDSSGVTAAFNLNILERLNRELNADFELKDFEHRAYYNEALHRVEMHLVALRDHKVIIPEIGEIRFTTGETILTELSYKYDRALIDDILKSSGMQLEQWIPDEDGNFALALARAV